MNTQEIVSKLWNLCNVLRDDGITYHQYVTELTYILFLKMTKETGTEVGIPEKYRWDALMATKGGTELKDLYRDLLANIAKEGQGKVKMIYNDAKSSIDKPANLWKIFTHINELDWYSAREEGLGNLYEGLLEKNATETKSGAGQYFTPRPLIEVMVQLMDPKPGERCNDPACGTFGFLIVTHNHIKANTNDLFDLDAKASAFQLRQAMSGCELVADTYRLALMNAYLHGLDCDIQLGDTLSSVGEHMNGYDLVLTNPPFGTKQGGERPTRTDLTFPGSNKQLNFL